MAVRRKFLVISSALIAILLTGGAVAAPDAERDDLNARYALVQKADEHTVVVYTPYGNLQPVWDAFAKRFPGLTVKTAVISGGGAPLLARVHAEAQTDQHIGDLVLSGLGDVNVLINEHNVVSDKSIESDALPAEFRDPDGFYQVPFTTLFTVVYNPRRISEKDLPKTLNDAVGQHWAGQFGYTLYTGAAAPDLVGAILAYNNAISDETLRSIKQNGQVSATAVTLLSNVAQGRVAFGLWGPTQNVRALQEQGAPIKVQLLEDSAVIMGPGLVLLSGAPHAEAAKLLKNWLYSEEGQHVLSQTASVYGTRSGTPPPPGLPTLDHYTFKSVPLNQFVPTLTAFRQRTQAIFGQ